VTSHAYNFNYKYAEDLLKLNLVPLSDYLGSSKNIEVKCLNCDRVFISTLNRLKSKHQVCLCVREQRKKEENASYLLEVKKFALSKNGECLTQEIKNRKDKVLWRCQYNHTWKQEPSVVLGKSKTWCPKCAGNFPRTLEELQVVVAKRKGKLLSTKYINSDSKYDFECMLGHKFSNSFRKVMDRGQWCPKCNKGYLSEEIARTTFEQIFKSQFPKTKPIWLKNQKGFQLEFDGFCEHLGIAFEYHGIQHFDPKRHLYKTNSKNVELEMRFSRGQDNDKIKLELAHSKNIIVFELTYKDSYEDFPKRIYDQALKFGLDVNEYDFHKEIDYSKAYLRENRLEDLKTLLLEKNIQLISKDWLGVRHKYEMQCLTCGHTWKAQGNAFFNSRRVAGCKKCAMKKQVESKRGKFEDLENFANKFNGSIISKKYITLNTIYDWKCSKGHSFKANFNNLKTRNVFCAKCEGWYPKEITSPQVALEKLLSFDYTPVSEYPGRRKYWEVRCNKCQKTQKVRLDRLLSGNPSCYLCSNPKDKPTDM
jgi:hypothetical protein